MPHSFRWMHSVGPRFFSLPVYCHFGQFLSSSILTSITSDFINQPITTAVYNVLRNCFQNANSCPQLVINNFNRTIVCLCIEYLNPNHHKKTTNIPLFTVINLRLIKTLFTFSDSNLAPFWTWIDVKIHFQTFK